MTKRSAGTFGPPGRGLRRPLRVTLILPAGRSDGGAGGAGETRARGVPLDSMSRRRRARIGCLKHGYGLAPLRVRGLARVQLHADLTMLARLAQALSRVREVPLAA